ncbi:MAG: TatD family hydrolase [Proteobacteria bacterium]|nr:TatD family hydrolase [Pseudomonadota bacterium]
MYIDSHCHLNMLELKPYEDDLGKVLAQAKEQGVNHLLSVAVTLEEHEKLVSIAKQFPQVFISAGLHPTENPEVALDVKVLDAQANHPSVVAIGETGLDYYRNEKAMLQWQQERFQQHIACARRFHKPLIIHTRAAKEDTLALMRIEKADEVGGVMHCFTEDWDMAKQAMDLNFYISFSGIVTFKNAQQIQDVARKMPLDKMLIETDSPYLAPVPHRGKSNVPAYVAFVAQFISEIRNEPLDKIAEQTTKNFFALFRSTSK